jgi:hypothetical protein
MKQARESAHLYKEVLRDHHLQGSSPAPEVVGEIGGHARAAVIRMGTKIIARIRFGKTTRRMWRNGSVENQPQKQ